ncbi:MAG TPA: formate dehydrogenase subunit delta [Alphaproteobacteria bacterium]|nr:formate dehydrogenase subunit delta [Alphaproteobacteria bacterium]
MANQISDFFAAYPHDEAVEGTATHLRNFWDPRMRAQLSQHLANGGEGLNTIALEAARALEEEAKAEN